MRELVECHVRSVGQWCKPYRVCRKNRRSNFAAPPSLAAALAAMALMGIWVPKSHAAELPGTQPWPAPPATEEIVRSHFEQAIQFWRRQIVRADQERHARWLSACQEPSFEAFADRQREVVAGMLGLAGSGPLTGPALAVRRLAGPQARVERFEVPMPGLLYARGLLVIPNGEDRRPAVVVCADADVWPERLLGLDGHHPPPRWLAELIARGAIVAVLQSVERLTDVPLSSVLNGKGRRMILYRLGYPVGRSMPGLDVADALAAVEYLRTREDVAADRIAIAGAGQGGMTALFAAALDPRIRAAAVADYFGPHAGELGEPIDRRLSGQAICCGDAELAALIAPRPLVIVAKDEAAMAGEYERARRLAEARKLAPPVLKAEPSQDPLATAVTEIAAVLELPQASVPVGLPLGTISDVEIQVARNRHFEERLAAMRRLIAESEQRRTTRWGLENASPQRLPELRAALVAEHRNLVGEIATPAGPPQARTDLALSTPAYRAYRVLLDVTDGVEVYGNLLVPVQTEGRRPAVVCQHGLSGTPEDVTGLGKTKDTVYHEFGRKLAEQGYVVFAPLILHYHPPQWTNDQARLADAVGKMRVALAVAQTRRVVDFLQSLPFVDSEKIGYYGLSYGGYSALWIPPAEPRLKTVVVSGHFNDWRSKITSESIATSYLLHPDEDFYNWDVLNRLTHVELVLAISPRPVAIEWGRRDAVTPPEWLAYAWKQLAGLRDRLGLQETIVLAEFDGAHEIHGTETFAFLDRFLRDR